MEEDQQNQNSESFLNDLTLKFANDSFGEEGLSNIEPPNFIDLSFVEGDSTIIQDVKNGSITITESSTTLISGSNSGLSFRGDGHIMHQTTITNDMDKKKGKNDDIFGRFNSNRTLTTAHNDINQLSKEDIEGNKYKLLCESLECIFTARGYQRKSYTLSQKKKFRDDFNESTFKDLGLNIATTKGCTTETFLHILKCCFELISPTNTRSKLALLWPIKDKKQITPIRKVFYEMIKELLKTNGDYFKGFKLENIPAVLQVPNGERFTRFLSGLLNYTLDKHLERKKNENGEVRISYHFKESNDIDVIKLQIQLLESSTKDLEKEIERERNDYMKNSEALEHFTVYVFPDVANYLPFDDTLTENQDLDDNLDDDLDERIKAYLSTQKVFDFEFRLSEDLLNKGLEDEIMDKEFQIGAILKEIDEPLGLFLNLIKKVNKRKSCVGQVKKYSIDASKILDDHIKETREREGVKYNFNELINLRIEEIQSLLKLQSDQPLPQSLIEMLLVLDKEFARVKKLLDEVNTEVKIKQIDVQLDLLHEEANTIDWSTLIDVDVSNVVSGWSKCLKRMSKKI